jgi:hypothetical protein
VSKQNKPIWDETELSTHEKISSQQGERTLPDTTNATKKQSKKKECGVTGNQRTRDCPKCQNELTYSTKYDCKRANVANSVCASCAHTGVIASAETRAKLSKLSSGSNNYFYGKRLCGKDSGFFGKKHTKEVIEKLKTDPRRRHYGKDNGFYGKTHTQATKDKIAENTRKHQTGRVKSLQERINISNAHKGKKFSDEHKAKISINSKINAINRKKKHGTLKIGFNPDACKYIDGLNEENGWELIHELNGGEVRVLNYFLDGYDSKRNIVVEYDEKQHFNVDGTLKENDIIRMKNIIDKLGCDFFRYNYMTKELIKWNKLL